MNGIEICKELRKINDFKNTSIIGINGFADLLKKEDISKAGFVVLLSKPIEIKDFIKTIQ